MEKSEPYNYAASFDAMCSRSRAQEHKRPRIVRYAAWWHVFYWHTDDDKLQTRNPAGIARCSAFTSLASAHRFAARCVPPRASEGST